MIEPVSSSDCSDLLGVLSYLGTSLSELLQTSTDSDM